MCLAYTVSLVLTKLVWRPRPRARGDGLVRGREEAEPGWKAGQLRPSLDPDVRAAAVGVRSSLCHHPLSQVGFINSLKFSSAGDFLVAGVGQEHR